MKRMWDVETMFMQQNIKVFYFLFYLQAKSYHRGGKRFCDSEHTLQPEGLLRFQTGQRVHPQSPSPSGEVQTILSDQSIWNAAGVKRYRGGALWQAGGSV